MKTSDSVASGTTPVSATRARKFLLFLGPMLSVAMLCVALWFLHTELAGLSRDAVFDYVRSLPTWSLMASVAFATCGYLTLTGYDAAALHYLKEKMPYRQSALTAFMAYAIGHNVGFTALSGGSIRYRMYSLAGLSATDIARIIVFVTVTFGLGASGLLGVALILMPTEEVAVLTLPPAILSLTGVLLVAVPVAYVTGSVLKRTPLKFGDWQFTLPAPSIALAQIGMSIADLVFAASTLYILLEPNLHVGFFPFAGVYLLAMAVGLVSSIPGGVGVFEAVLVAAFPQIHPAAMLGTILIYRLIYYVIPLSLALVFLVSHESQQHGHLIRKSTDKARDWIAGIVPQVLALTVFLAGVVLLVSGASPGVESRLAIISRGIPLFVQELSHLAGSVVGVGLLILARGIYRRLHGAFLATSVALSVGIGMSLLKALDYEEALILGSILVILWMSREEFYRRGSIVTQKFSARWIAAIAIVLGLALWIGVVSFRHVSYSSELWWQFAFDADAPRALRAGVSVAVTAIGFALWKVLRGSSNIPQAVSIPDEKAHIRRLLEVAKEPSANIALLGDKRFLWSADRQAFIMYQVSGDSWIALGDPVGSENLHEELAWQFRELADQYDGRVVFYQVSDKSLSLYVDLGLALAKLGEDARVSLSDFSLQGSQRADLRQALNRSRKNGAVFEVISSAAVPTIMSALRNVSDNWLAEKSTREKGFSLGSFSEDYVAEFDCAVVRINGEIVAFANLWPAPAGRELSIDLMRYDRHAPKGIMDYLFVELMLWSAAQDYQWFNLGMAPLSGLEQRALAPIWHKLGHLIFTHGESFYNFEGLRHYKEKFDPLWEPRYLACPAGWRNVSLSLLDVSRLISGGTSRILVK